ncbi:MAG: ribosome-associated translation inhibitor RaiA [Pseudomonadota bacterium]
MQVKMTGHHVDITDALRDHVNSKLTKLERHFDHIVDVQVTLTVEKNRHRAEATLNLGGGLVHAESEEEQMYAAIDLLIDKLDRQVLRHKEKLTDHHAKEAHRQRLAEQ